MSTSISYVNAKFGKQLDYLEYLTLLLRRLGHLQAAPPRASPTGRPPASSSACISRNTVSDAVGIFSEPAHFVSRDVQADSLEPASSLKLHSWVSLAVPDIP